MLWFNWSVGIIVSKMMEHLNKLFMAVIILSLFTYFERGDYNLPLFAFILLSGTTPSSNKKPASGTSWS